MFFCRTLFQMLINVSLSHGNFSFPEVFLDWRRHSGSQKDYCTEKSKVCSSHTLSIIMVWDVKKNLCRWNGGQSFCLSQHHCHPSLHSLKSWASKGHKTKFNQSICVGWATAIVHNNVWQIINCDFCHCGTSNINLHACMVISLICNIVW